MSLLKLVGMIFVLAFVMAFILPSVNINGKGQPEVWTTENEKQLRSQCPPINANDLNRYKR